MQNQSSHAEVDTAEQIRAVLKALSDPVRLRMLGRLAEGPAKLDEVAGALGIGPAALPVHVHVLQEAGMLEGPAAGTVRLSLRPVHALLRATASAPDQRFSEGLPDDTRSILRRFFDGAVLRSIPAQRKMKDLVFEEILRRLPAREEYPERELNELLKAIHPDFCTVRRELVDGAYMERAGGIYRMAEKGRKAVAAG
jgi:ArsR family transcriptional regulator, arsenate/arsenite/antimonite-responsive transcriptional repressor